MCSPCNCPKCESVRVSVAFVMVFQNVAVVDTALLGLAISLDKPIIVVACPPGTKLPEKLVKVVDRFIEVTDGMEPSQIAALVEMGVIKHQPRAPYDTAPSHN